MIRFPEILSSLASPLVWTPLSHTMYENISALDQLSGRVFLIVDQDQSGSGNVLNTSGRSMD